MTGIATAAAIAARGFKVFPIAPNAKAPPLWADWPNRSSTTLSPTWPEPSNVGIHCKGMIVLDVDVRNGGDESFTALDLEYGLPDTLTARTPTGGRHLFYALPEGHPGVGNSAGKLGAGLDIKTTGGYVVGAGSRTAAGDYTWIDSEVGIAPAPEWLVLKLGTIVPNLRTSHSGAGAIPTSESIQV